MKKMSSKSEIRIAYERRKSHIDGYDYGMFDDLNLDLRKTCNKIIHSEVMEPHTKEGNEAHESDAHYWYGEAERSINWDHLNGYVRLAGKERGAEWYVLLDVEIFVIAIYELLAPENVDPAA